MATPQRLGELIAEAGAASRGGGDVGIAAAVGADDSSGKVRGLLGGRGLVVPTNTTTQAPLSPPQSRHHNSITIYNNNTRQHTPKQKVDCYKVRDAKECAAARACVYCRNKWSPSAGNDGVCVERGKQGELPAWAYDCGKKGGGGGASGGDDHSGGDWWPPSSSAAAAEGGA